MKLKIRIFLNIFFLFIVFNGINYQSFAENDISFIQQEVIDIAELGDQLYNNGSSRSIYEWVFIDSTGTEAMKRPSDAVNYIKSTIFCSYKSPKVRWEEQIYIQKSNYRYMSQLAFDGFKTDCLYIDNQTKSNLAKPRGFIIPGNIITRNHEPFYYSLSIEGISIASFLRGTKDNNKFGNVYFINEDTQNNSPCKIFSTHEVSTGKEYKIWLDTTKMYRPIRIEVSSSNESYVINNIFKKNNENIYIPQKTIVDIFYHNGEKNMFREIITVIEFNILADLPDSLFTVNFSKGLTIFDKRTEEKIEIK